MNAEQWAEWLASRPRQSEEERWNHNMRLAQMALKDGDEQLAIVFARRAWTTRELVDLSRHSVRIAR